MKRSSLTIAMFTLLGATLSSGAATDSATGIHRCEAADGNAIYTDKTCAEVAASVAPISDELRTRIAMSEVSPLPNDGAGYPLEEYPDASAPLPLTTYGRRPLADGCARTPQQLSQDLVGSFALHDVNRMAESYHWVGMTQHQALPVMKQLEHLAAQPLADARFLAAWISSEELAPSAIADDAGRIQLMFAGDGAREVDFKVRRYSGCYFISA